VLAKGDLMPGAVCFRCRGRECEIVKLGSEAHLVKCRKCGFQFACEPEPPSAPPPAK
jgi:hypothetical protein